ncbi:hypothetical protein J3A84_14920 [Proteiniclasticum sp. SCR006]|uniref:Sugar translocase n=1 Tax=Proteiniclasticum aestuarii TaxID=2817862 RepID=A0A939KM51_9CLOT|nr:hypothetical protein [Proteiniclasticum aestuarii]MBO1266325.1 hypothetical protein [Proteiniclasticum aestuarii]
MSRTTHSIRNAKFSVIAQVLGLALNFITRSLFVYLLGAEYLGLNGLFTNILSVLSLAELGVGSAIVYSIYKPLADNDIDKLKTLMRLFRKAYFGIGSIIFIGGMLATPLLDLFITSDTGVKNINFIYWLFLFNSSISYFFSYKRSLIIADQKKYIDILYQYTGILVTKVMQILVLVLTRNYIGFLLIQILVVFTENYLISRKANRIYPFLSEKNVTKIDDYDKKKIVKNIKALFFHRVGAVVVTGTDNLLISRYVGIIEVGIYSNYLLIISSLKVIYDMLFQSITASVGNLGATESKNKVYDIFKKIDFIGYWIYGFSSIALLILLNPFIKLWLGSQYLFSDYVVALIALNFYIRGMRHSVLTFRDALGIFYYDRYKPIFEALINLIFSILLAIEFGVFGVLLGTLISSITTSLWVEPYVLYKYGFNLKVRDYFERYINKFIFVLITSGVMLYIVSLINTDGFLSFFLRIILVTIIPNALFYCVYRSTNEFEYMLGLVKRVFLKKDN